MHRSSLLVPLLVAAHVAARAAHLPEDPFAFPKFRVSFLNGQPVLNETAQRWLRDGLHGCEPEFLDQPWHEARWDTPSPLREIGAGGDDHQATLQAPSSYSLEHMKMGPRNSYLCLIPPSLEQTSPPAEEPQTEVTLAHSWSLLQPLAGSCIYLRQGWFTYAYCHNSHVRQFREMIRAQAHTPGSYQIEEDPDWEAYDLGRAPHPDTDTALTVSEQAALTANLELARTAGSRYLVQRWGDGTVCDKTGKRREIEVQFHCSMTMTDSIMFVKETKTCHYVLVVNTPRLCGEPGFKSRLDHREEALIRCRQIVDSATLAATDDTLPESDHPFRRVKGVPVAPIDAPKGKSDDEQIPPANDDTSSGESSLDSKEIMRQTIAAILAKTNVPGAGGVGAPHVHVEDVGDGEMVIEFISDIDLGDEDLMLEFDLDDDGMPDGKALEEALRAAGYDVRSDVEITKKDKKVKGKGQPTGKVAAHHRRANAGRDEL
ncbi:hypothetical protein BV25DRAFT_1868736 [Artomyces pyxidatus]|uniref:Uncharacterized protein n=1 Tax=Artomyces pyxidatus TaxID=48021 RepID=A0ACB8T9E8_9AGAM|nr:hypothetical protein BV25DRAFT_1868736 [Artomyces pyxidatus]